MKKTENLENDLFVPPNYQYAIIVSPDCLLLKEPLIKALRNEYPSNFESPLVVGSEKIGYSYDVEKLLDFDALNGLSLNDILSYENLYYCDENNTCDENDSLDEIGNRVLFFVMYDSIRYQRNRSASSEMNFFTRYICAIDLSVCSHLTINEVIAYHLKHVHDNLCPTNQRRANYFIHKFVDQQVPFEKVK